MTVLGWRRQVALFLLATLGSFAGQVASRLLWFPPVQFSTIWIPGGLFLAALILRPQREWWAITLGFVIGGGTPLVPLGPPYVTAYIGYIGVGLPIMLAAVVLRRATPFADLSALLCFMLIAVVVLPLVTGSFTAFMIVATGLARDFTDAWLTLAPAQNVSFLLLTPPILALATMPPGLWSFGRIAEALLLVAGLVLLAIGLSVAIPATPQMLALLIFAPVPLLLLAALRFGSLGAGIGLLVAGSCAAWLGLYRRGPFSMMDGRADVHLLQLWLLMVGVLMHVVAVLTQQQRSLNRQVTVSRDRIHDLAGRLMRAQEDERTRIARELHDGVNQQLALLAIRASAGDRRLHELIQETAEEVRRISHNLHPAALEHAGLVGALETLAEEVAANWVGSLRFTHTGTAESPGTDVGLVLYRIAQEGLVNAIRHADATVIEMRLALASNAITLMIEDDGRGFDLEAANRRGGLGLLSMEERVVLVGGSIVVEAAAGRGTRLRIIVPRRA